MGVAWSSSDAVAYAAIVTWVPGEETLDAPFERMHALGERLASRMW
jgi:Ser/Thr protein kinase RdoA (MazF antagonist)